MAAALLPGLRRMRAEFPFDVIDAEFFWPDGPAAMHLARALGLPFSVKARGADIHHWGRRSGTGGQIAEAAAAASGLLAVSEALADDMAALGIPRDRIRTHRTGVDLDRFTPVDRAVAKARLGVSGPLLVTAGALIPRKGQALVLEALRAIPGATLFLVGEGPDRRALERQVRVAGIGGRVRLLGSRPHADLPGLLAAADALVLPSSSEGLANVWVEALACGTPIVISDVGGAQEVVDRPEAGRLVGRDPVAIAAAVRALLAAPPSQPAVRAAAERFSWDRNARELRDHLADMVERNRVVRAA
jgi:glycosyltransferase involved in cell wall biosynthesis